MLDNIGVPVSGINLTYDSSDPIGSEDADIMITLEAKPQVHRALCRETSQRTGARHFPGVTFAFLPADIVSQILNFGLPAPIDMQIVGNKLARKPRRRRPSARATAQCARPCRCAYPTARRRTDHQRRCRSHEGDAGWPHAARRRAEPFDRALRQLANHAELLARPKERRQLSADGRSAAIRYSFAANALEHSVDDESNHRRSPKPARHARHDVAQLATGRRLALQRATRARYIRIDSRTRPGRRRVRRHEARR